LTRVQISSILFTSKHIKELQNEAIKYEINLSRNEIEKILNCLECGDIDLARSIITKHEFNFNGL